MSRQPCPDNRRFTVLSIGALARDKGTFDLVDASRILMDNGVDHRLILVGPEMSAFSRWFTSSGAGACNWIERRGIVSDDEKGELLRDADVFVLPSRSESFGIVYLEAWSYGKPVIGASIGAVAEVIEDGVDGLLIPFGDPGALAAAIKRLHGSKELARRLGRAGLEKTRSTYTWSHVFDRLEQGFETVLGMSLR